MTQRLDFRLARSVIKRRIDVFIGKSNPAGEFISVARPLEMIPCDDETLITEPAFVLRFDDAQDLMDELWNCGLRPTEGSGSAGALAATERHLKDMRTICLGLLGKDGIKVE